MSRESILDSYASVHRRKGEVPMKSRVSMVGFAVAWFGLTLSGPVAAQSVDEAACRQVVQGLQDGWNRKDGKAFAAAFAEEHSYVTIQGLFLPKGTRDGNAAAHQRLFDGVYKEVDVELRVASVRPLSPEIAVVHVAGHTHAKGKPADKLQEVIITTVLRRTPGAWEIVAFQNTPVQPRPESRPGG
jgi:uncharacterized protein (TIGR02246 family)